jgi:hypothetical protein
MGRGVTPIFSSPGLYNNYNDWSDKNAQFREIDLSKRLYTIKKE